MGRKGLTLVVADGMGGAASGEVASQMAVDFLHEEFAGADLGGSVQSERDVIGLIETAIHKANAAIHSKGQSSKEHQGMGTTLTASVVLGDSLYLSQVGDSRGYLLRKGKLTQMTRDQSLIEQLIDEGTITPEQAKELGGKNIILQALGVEETLKIDSKRFDLLRGDTLLVCSDGLTGFCEDEAMQAILLEETDLSRATQRLIDAANAGGGKDNITVILARFDGPGLREPLTVLGEDERSKGIYEAPKLVPKKTGRNTAIGATLVLLLLFAFLAWPRNVTLKYTVLTDDGSTVAATVKVLPAEGDEEVIPAGTVNSGEVYEGSVKKGKYRIRVTAEGYTPSEFDEDTTSGQVIFERRVALGRIPAKSLLLKAPLYKGRGLDRVKVVLEPAKVGDPQTVVIDPAAKDPQFTKFPAGKWKATLTRDGFAKRVHDFEIRSDEAEVIALPSLDEEFGTLQIREAFKGGEIMVYDGDEQLLDKPVMVDITKRAAVKVRATAVRLSITATGYRPYEKPRVEVRKDETTEESLISHHAMLTLTGGAQGASVRITQANARGTTVDFGANGKTAPRPVPPGTSDVDYTTLDGTARKGTIVLEPGQILEQNIGEILK
jgi:serine/threonine protein phosphatase PrpC